MKKRLAVILSAIMVLTMFGGQFAFAVSADQFTDVEADGWYKPDVDFVAEHEYMVGTSDTTFEPQSNLTRAMFATILARYDGAEVDNSKETVFTDVEVDQWFTGSIGWANEKAIVEGIGDNQFAPASFITREQLATMVERYITYVESTTDRVHVTPGVAIPFTDADQISAYAKDAMDKAVIHGLIIGYPDKSVKPLQNITRAETAAVIHRIKWKTRDGRETFTLTIKDEEGNVLGTPEEYPVDQVLIAGVDFEAPQAPDGQTFVGWEYTDPETGAVTPILPGYKIKMDGDRTLIAKFSDGRESYEVTLIDAVNNQELGKDTVTAGETYTAPAGPAKSGYTFKEWNTSKDGKGTSYKPNDQILVNEDMNLYAIYTKKSSGGGGGNSQATIQFEGLDKENKTYEKGAVITIPETAVMEDQVVTDENGEPVLDENGQPVTIPFVGWTDGSGRVFAPGMSYTITGNTVFTPVYGDVYEVTAALKVPSDLNDEVQLSSIYPVGTDGTGDPTIDVVMKDLVTGDNATLIKNAIQSVIDDLESFHEKTVEVNGSTYVVTLDPDTGKVTATKDGTAVENWDTQLTAEQALYNQRLADLGVAADVEAAGAKTEWDNFAKALSPENLITAEAGSMAFKEANDYLTAVQDAATNAGIVLQKLGEAGFTKAYTNVLNYMTGTLGITLGNYTVDGQPYSDPASVATFAEAVKDANGIILDLTDKGNKEYVALDATETLTKDGLLDTINERISRNWKAEAENSAAIVAFLKANMVDADSKFFGDYELKVTVRKK